MASILFLLGLGWFIGTLLNYLTDVLPRKRCLTIPFCLHCDAPIPVINYLIPIMSCPSCRRRRSLRSSIIVVFFMIITVWLWKTPLYHRIPFILGMVLMFYFVLVAVIDWEHHVILHRTTAVGFILGLVNGIWLHGWYPTLLGGLVGFGVGLLLYFFGYLFTKVAFIYRKGSVTEEALGFGDVSLSGVLGLMVGYPSVIVSLIIAILLGGAVSLLYVAVMLLKRQYHSFSVIPYGPFLIGGAIAVLFFPDYIRDILIQ